MGEMTHEVIRPFLVTLSGYLRKQAYAINRMLGRRAGLGSVHDGGIYIHDCSNLLMMKMIAGDLKGVSFSYVCPAGNKRNSHATFIAGSFFPRRGAELK